MATALCCVTEVRVPWTDAVLCRLPRSIAERAGEPAHAASAVQVTGDGKSTARAAGRDGTGSCPPLPLTCDWCHAHIYSSPT